MITRTIAFLLLLLGPAVSGHDVMANAQTDSTLWQKNLQNVEVKGHRVRSYLDKSVPGATVVDLRLMDNMPRIMGNADPIRYVQMLPGVQTNSESDAGLHLQGCDNQHNAVSIDGVPLYNVTHLMGFFSVFNASHFQDMEMEKSAASVVSPNRLGGFLDMKVADSVPSSVHGMVAVGPISSQGTLRLPLGKRSVITVSARAAYMNLLYSRWLQSEGEQMRYSFDDYNLTWMYRPNERHTIWLEGYYGGDRVKMESLKGIQDVRMNWMNGLGALHWDYHHNGLDIKQTFYVTHFQNKAWYDENQLKVSIPSDITDWGWQLKASSGRMTFGTQFVAHSIQPQSPEVIGFLSFDSDSVLRQHTLEASAYADYRQPLGRRAEAHIGVRGTAYRSDDHTMFYSADPALSVILPTTVGKFSLRTSVKHQYMFRSGFSDSGLPTEFWFAADSHYRPQHSLNLSLAYERSLCEGMYRLEFEAYYKILRRQVEYYGNIFDFLYGTYQFGNALLTGKGRNYGASVMVEKRRGKLTGWLSYSVGRALRKFDDARYVGWFPASHERIHELNAVATYHTRGRWSYGGTFIMASGTPYTSPRQFYVINNNLISEFGEYNANRLSPYIRMDISVNYDLKSEANGRRSGFNFSIYNVLMRRNVMMYRLKVYENKFANRPYRLILPFIPSLNYYWHF